MEQIEILETIIVLLCVVVGALVIGMIAIMVVVREQQDKIDGINEHICDLKGDIAGARRFYSSELTRKQQDIDNLYRNKKDKTKEEIILEEIEKNRETLEKNINDRLNK